MWQKKHCAYQVIWGRACTGIRALINAHSIYTPVATLMCTNKHTCMCTTNKPCPNRLILGWTSSWCTGFWAMYIFMTTRAYAPVNNVHIHTYTQANLIHINCFWGGRVVGAQAFEQFDQLSCESVSLYSHVLKVSLTLSLYCQIRSDLNFGSSNSCILRNTSNSPVEISEKSAL